MSGDSADRLRTILGIVVESSVRWFRHGSFTLSAALAFYAVTSLAPLLIVAVAIAGTVLGDDAVRAALTATVTKWVGSDIAVFVESVPEAWSAESGLLAGILLAGAFLFASTAAFEHVLDSLNRIWGVAAREDRVLRDMIRRRVLAFGLVFAVGLVLLVSLVLRAALAAIGDRAAVVLPYASVLVRIGDLTLFVVGLGFLFALVYRVLPEGYTPWKDALVGALVTAVLFVAGEILIGFYIGQISFTGLYGALGSVVALLFWFYYSSMVFYWGAEFTCAYSRAGWRQPSSPAVSGE